MVEKNVEFRGSEMAQNDSLVTFWKQTLTMVEENFEFWGSEMVQNDGLDIFFERKPSPWLKKILNFQALKWSRMKVFDM